MYLYCILYSIIVYIKNTHAFTAQQIIVTRQRPSGHNILDARILYYIPFKSYIYIMLTKPLIAGQ